LGRDLALAKGEAVSTRTQICDVLASLPGLVEQEQNWYALLTRARHEKVVADRLREQGLTSFLPLVSEVRRWSDRRKVVELPLFSCYVFAKLLPTHECRLRALQVDGVLSVVGTRGQGTPIPDDQIDAVRRLVEGHLPFHSHPFLKVGQRVRIRNGALKGLEGILVSRSGGSIFVISIDAIQRSLAVRVEGYDVEPA
jgi:transcription antitermination factor NusG